MSNHGQLKMSDSNLKASAIRSLEWERDHLGMPHSEVRQRSEWLLKLIEDHDRLRKQMGTLFDRISHGDDAHRAWLKAAIEEHFSDAPNAGLAGTGGRSPAEADD